jgi:hypothetical protein
VKRALLLTLGAAIVSAAAVWLLLPRTPDAFTAVRTALAVGSTPASGPGGPYVYRGSTSPSSTGPGQVTSPAVSPSVPAGTVPAPIPPYPGPHDYLPPWVSPLQPVPSQQIGQPQTAAFRIASAGSGPGTPPPTVIGQYVNEAYASSHAATITVDIAGRDLFAVAAVPDADGHSPLPVLGAAAVISALAAVGGGLLARNRARLDPIPVTATAPALMSPGTDRAAGQDLQRLRRGAQQKTALARSVAELLPSMPEALYWQVEKALADIGVRTIVPDGEPFDPAAHYAVGTEPLTGGVRENTVARTVRPGYSDGENILVYPKVVIYADDADGQAP